jgi:hypothetical protein
VVTDKTRQFEAEEKVLHRCDNGPDRKGRDRPVSHAVGDHVILPQRLTRPRSLPRTVAEAFDYLGVPVRIEACASSLTGPANCSPLGHVSACSNYINAHNWSSLECSPHHLSRLLLLPKDFQRLVLFRSQKVPIRIYAIARPAGN